MPESVPELLSQIHRCQVCAQAMARLPLPTKPNPVVQASRSARLLIIGQAPGMKVHQSGIPWNDPSGDRLREWLQIDRATFYNEEQVAIVPMGLCFPGYQRSSHGKLSDRPPRSECAPLWHARLLAAMPDIELTLLIGAYSQKYYASRLPEELQSVKTLTERVSRWREFPSGLIPLVHPSPRNRHWLLQNPWFELELVPELRERVYALF